MRDRRLVHNAVERLQNDNDFWNWLIDDYPNFIMTRQFNRDLTLITNRNYSVRVEVLAQVVCYHVDGTPVRYVTIRFEDPFPPHIFLPHEEIIYFKAKDFWKRLPFAIKQRLFYAYVLF